MSAPRRSSLEVQKSKDDLLKDELGILPDDTLLRWLKTDKHIGFDPDTGRYVSSKQAWTTQKPGGCSVEIKELIDEAGSTIADRLSANHASLHATIKAGSPNKIGTVRSTMNRADEKGKNEKEPLKVAYTPIPPDEPFGPNPFHCDIFPPLASNGKKRLAGHAVLTDQEAAARLYKSKHGLSDA